MAAVGAPEVTAGNGTFVSLGFGGALVLEFAPALRNGPGADLRVFDASIPTHQPCEAYPERFEVLVSNDDMTYTSLGTSCVGDDMSFDLPDDFMGARFVKVIDRSNSSDFDLGSADGIDVDGITCLNGRVDDAPQPDPCATAATVEDYAPGLRKNGRMLPAGNSQPMNALGAADGQFVSLGFGGSLTVMLDGVLYDRQGDDFMVLDFGVGRTTCNSYPERVRVEVSSDNMTYQLVGEGCLTQPYDLGAAGIASARYVRVTDVSDPARFSSGSANGFDVDAIVCLNGDGSAARMAPPAATAKEASRVTLFPNPTDGLVTLRVSGGDVARNVRVYNSIGRMVHEAPAQGSSVRIDLQTLPAGIYWLRVQTEQGTETVRFLKNQ